MECLCISSSLTTTCQRIVSFWGQEPVQPAVIVHIYDAILQNVRDLCKCLERVTADGDDSLTDDPLETLDRISYDEAL